MSNLQHPSPGDSASGTEVAWRDEPDEFEVLTWYGYSAETGEYRATLTRWSVNREKKTIRLEWVSMRQPYSGWHDDFTSPAALVPDAHRRKAREIGREQFDMGKFKRLRLY